MSFLSKLFRRKKTIDEMKNDVLKKANSHLKEKSQLSEIKEYKTKKSKAAKKQIDPNIKMNVRNVLIMLAHSGETGVLPKSISDYLNISSIETKNALVYLVGKKYAEVINGALGEKYYLSELGRRYCINKKYT